MTLEPSEASRVKQLREECTEGSRGGITRVMWWCRRIHTCWRISPAWVLTHALVLCSWVTLDKSLNFSGPSFSHLQNEEKLLNKLCSFFFFNLKICCLCFLFIYFYIYFWLCWVFASVQGLSPVAASGGHSSSRCVGLSLSRPLLLWSTGSRCAGSVVVAHGPSCSTACGIFPDQGSNPCPLRWQADSQPLRHQGSPALFILWKPLKFFKGITQVSWLALSHIIQFKEQAVECYT